jgi:hypothetical protein
MKKTIDHLKDAISIIKMMGAELGVEITGEEIARKMELSREQFGGYLNATDKTPNEVLTRLWASYADLFKAVQRSNNSVPLRNKIKLVKELGLAKGMDITDEEIVEKLAIPRELFEAYLSGELATPREVLSLFYSAWPRLFENVLIETISIMEEVDGEDTE